MLAVIKTLEREFEKKIGDISGHSLLTRASELSCSRERKEDRGRQARQAVKLAG